jgi:anti-anti-sigma regulatory factor
MGTVGFQSEPEPFAGFEVATVSADTLRAGVRVHGTLQRHNVALLTSVLRTHMTAGRRYLRVDLTEAAIVDSAVVAALVESHSALAAVGGMLVFENAGPQVVDAAASASLFIRAAER